MSQTSRILAWLCVVILWPMNATAEGPSINRKVGALLQGTLGILHAARCQHRELRPVRRGRTLRRFPFATSWRATLDLGFGGAPYMSAGDPNYGVSRSVGGFYVGPRLLLGYDVTRHLYVRAGGEALFATSPSQWSEHGVVELGTSVPGTLWCGAHSDFELGLRPYIGRDGVQTTGASTTWLIGYGGSLVVRIGLRL